MSLTTSTTLILITGANQGIGLATARLLASQSPNHHILLGSRDAIKGKTAAAALQSEGLFITHITIDVTSDASISAAAELVSRQFGRLDVLINNSGISLEGQAPKPPPRQVWEDVFAVNVFGAAATTDAFVPLLQKSEAPKIVFVSSGLGSLANYADPETEWAKLAAPVYRTSKAALNMIMLGYANAWGKEGWRVNCADPGYTSTNLNAFRGTGTVEVAAGVVAGLAILGKDGPNGKVISKDGEVRW